MEHRNEASTVIHPKNTVSENIINLKGIFIVVGSVLIFILSFYLFY
ncbi:hypothetical protein [[Eubacterium] hominis]